MQIKILINGIPCKLVKCTSFLYANSFEKRSQDVLYLDLLVPYRQYYAEMSIITASKNLKDNVMEGHIIYNGMPTIPENIAISLKPEDLIPRIHVRELAILKWEWLSKNPKGKPPCEIEYLKSTEYCGYCKYFKCRTCPLYEPGRVCCGEYITFLKEGDTKPMLDRLRSPQLEEYTRSALFGKLEVWRQYEAIKREDSFWRLG